VKIAKWLGWKEARCTQEDNSQYGWYTTNNGFEKYILDWHHTSAAFDLLDVLVERGYRVDLANVIGPDGWAFTVYHDGAGLFTYEHSTKSAAICEALASLIDMEAKSE
jgi:exonuclease I